MNRYIDADGLVQKINAYVITTQDVEYIKKLINETEPADVAPVIHAHWNYLGEFDGEGNFIFRCSNCHAVEIKSNLTPINYCWHCGAKMDEEE